MSHLPHPARTRPAAVRLVGLLLILGLLASSLFILAVAQPPSASAEAISNVDLTFGAGPEQIVAGPDGNLWFTEYDGNRVGRLVPGGGVTEFSAGITAGSGPFGITAGPDGNLWFTEQIGNRIGRITPAGVVTEFSAGISANAGLHSIVAGGDGNLWFTEQNGDRIGRITPSGVVTEFAAGITAAAVPTGIAAGPDGHLWFTEYNGNRIGRITTEGVVTEFSSGMSPGATPNSITAAADGSMWFTEIGVSRIGQITMNGLIFENDNGQKPHSITAGPDGNTWFTEVTTDDIGRITPTGAIQKFANDDGSDARGIATGSDGRIYFARHDTHEIGIVDQLDGSPFVPVTPVRILDSRGSTGGWQGSKLTHGASRSLDVADAAGIPVYATSVVLNVTVTDSTAGSFLSVWPDGTPPPNASNLNFAAGETTANQVVVRVGTEGRVRFSTAVGQTHVVVDLVGYYDTGGTEAERYIAVDPTFARILDSRGPVGGFNGVPLGADGIQTKPLLVHNQGGVSTGATAVVLNVTVTNASAGSFLRVTPTGAPPSNISNVNFAAGQTKANLVTVPIGAGGKIDLFTAVGSTHVIVDAVGYYSPIAGKRYHALRGPTRIVDSRLGLGLSGPVGSSMTGSFDVRGTAGNPSGVPGFARSIAMNVTVTDSTNGSFLTVYPSNIVTPNSSNINFGAGQTIPNMVISQVPSGSQVTVYNAVGAVHVIADATGWFGDD